MQNRPIIAFACRDAAAANNYAPLITYLNGLGLYDVRVFAGDPACRIFARNGITSTTVTVGEEHACITALEKIKPAIVMTGLTSISGGSGLDEIVLRNVDAPCLVYQDWPGYFSQNIPRKSHIKFLVNDEPARTLAIRAGFNACAVGQPAYDGYAAKNYSALRAAFRAAQPGDKRLVTFFGQYLTQFDGYLALVTELAACLQGKPNAHLVYRPHPREGKDTDIAKTSAIFDRFLPGRWSFDKEAVQDPALAGSDVAVSYCSTSLRDLVVMNAYSPEALALPVAMMWDKALNKTLDVAGFPWLNGHNGHAITVPTDFNMVMLLGLRSDMARTAAWEETSRLSPLEPATHRVATVIANTLK